MLVSSSLRTTIPNVLAFVVALLTVASYASASRLGTPPDAHRKLIANEMNLADINIRLLTGSYRVEPAGNDWHYVEIATTKVADRQWKATWTNQAGFSWSLVNVNGMLMNGLDSPYPQQQLRIEGNDKKDKVVALHFGNDRYVSTTELFYENNGGRGDFSANFQSALDRFIEVEDQVASGEYDLARSWLVNLFSKMPTGNTNFWDANLPGGPNGVMAG